MCNSFALVISNAMCTIENDTNTSNVPNLGLMIKEQVLKRGVKVKWLAEQLGCHRNNIYKIYEKSWIDTQTLMKLSITLKHNFFKELSDYYIRRYE